MDREKNTRELKTSVIREIDTRRHQLSELCLKIHGNPELGFHEIKAADWLMQYLEENGFSIERGICKLPTAFRASYGKGKPVIGGRAAGIKGQIKNGENGFLAGSVQETSKRIVELLKNQQLAEKMGQKAHLSAKKNFLLPRLLRDYLKLFVHLISTEPKNSKGQGEIMDILNCY